MGVKQRLREGEVAYVSQSDFGQKWLGTGMPTFSNKKNAVGGFEWDSGGHLRRGCGLGGSFLV